MSVRARLLLIALALGAPRLAFAQAEPAPPEPAPAPTAPPVNVPPPAPTAETAAEPLDYQLAVGAHFARRLGTPAQTLDPVSGFGVTVAGDWIYSRAAGLELSLGVGFGYQRFRDVVTIELPQNLGGNQEGERSFTYYEYDAHTTLAWPLGFFRPYLRAGFGFSMAYFSTREPAYAPGEKRSTRPVVPAAFGFDVPTGRGGRVGLELGATWLLGATDLVTDTGRSVPVFGNRASLGLCYRQPF
jgi:hypothetical protein